MHSSSLNISWNYPVPCEVSSFGSDFVAFKMKWRFTQEIIWNLTVFYYHVTYEFQGESTLYSLLECQGTPCSKQSLYLKFK